MADVLQVTSKESESETRTQEPTVEVQQSGDEGCMSCHQSSSQAETMGLEAELKKEASKVPQKQTNGHPEAVADGITEPLFEAELLTRLKWDQKKASYRENVSVSFPGKNLHLRPLCLADYKKGYLKLLRELTSVGDYTEEHFKVNLTVIVAYTLPDDVSWVKHLFFACATFSSVNTIGLEMHSCMESGGYMARLLQYCLINYTALSPSSDPFVRQVSLLWDWQERFEAMKRCENTYYIAVIEDTKADEKNKVIGSASLVLEQKFIHNAGQRGRIEDVVVRPEYRGKQLGKLLVECMTLLGKELGCYKMSLECRPDRVEFYSMIGYERDGQYFMVQRYKD